MHTLKWQKVRRGEYRSRCSRYRITNGYVGMYGRNLWWITFVDFYEDGDAYIDDVGGTTRLRQAKYIAWGHLLKREAVTKRGRARTAVFAPKWFNERPRHIEQAAAAEHLHQN
jgi:hypothetical protein